MKIVFFALMFFVLGSCGKPCTVDDFEDFEMDKIDSNQYRFFSEQLIKDLKPGIAYKFKDKSQVSFAKGKDFTVVSFEMKLDHDLNLEKVKVKNVESEIKLGECYWKSGYMGQILKHRSDNTKRIGGLVFNVLSSKIKKKVLSNESIYLEGIVQNIGLYAGHQEFIFLPFDDAMFSQKEDFHMKIFLIVDDDKLMSYVFYSKEKILTDVLDYLNNEQDSQAASED